ncbi:MAG: hypothetical protein JKY34_03230 [Kordiimonadaceae bacterium]|nr:hypothetical protein [Kordiimonadaceae bacterium]
MRRLDDPYYRVSPARETGLLDVGEGHQIYWTESGNPQGMPLLILHGGPGGASNDGTGFLRTLRSFASFNLISVAAESRRLQANYKVTAYSIRWLTLKGFAP